jgi:hypothetical protein
MTKPAFKTSKTRARERGHVAGGPSQTWISGLGALLLLAGWLVGSSPLCGQQAVSLLDLPVLTAGPWQAIPLRDALGHLGSSVSEGYVLFGLEEQLRDGKGPTVNLDIRTETRLGTALRDLLAQLPPYEMEVVSDHLINLRPKGTKDDPDSILNLRVASFDAVSKPAYVILDAPRDVIPELNAALRPKPEPGKQVIELYFGGHHGGPPVTLHLKNVTVREILNATSVATDPYADDHLPGQAPRGWVCTFNPNPSPGNSNYSWGSLFSMPRTWRLHENQRKVAPGQ